MVILKEHSILDCRLYLLKLKYLSVSFMHVFFQQLLLYGLPLFSILVTVSNLVLSSPRICEQHMSRVMRNSTICICENKDADQLRGNREADQRLWFRYIDSTIPLLS